MASDIVNSLFGVDPAAYQSKMNEDRYIRDLQAVKLDPMQQANLAIRQGAGTVAQAAAPLFGAQDPMLQKATMARQLANQFDISSPQGLQQYAQALAQNGAPDLAQMAMAKAQDLLAKASTMQVNAASINLKNAQAEKALREPDEGTKALIGKSTPASVARYMQSGNIGDLELVDKGLTGTALDKVSTAQQNLQNLSQSDVDISTWMDKTNPKNPKVAFGPGASIAAFISRVGGSPTDNAIEQDKLRRFIGNEANELLVAAKGTQTEGDAKRAYSNIMSSLDKNSNESVYAALEDLKKSKLKVSTGLETYISSMTSKGQKQTPVPTRAVTPNSGIYTNVRNKPGWNDASDAEIDAAIKSGKIKVGKQ